MDNDKNITIYKCYSFHLRDESNKYDYDLGYVYLYKKDTKLILYHQKDSFSQFEKIYNILTFDMDYEIPEYYYRKIIDSFLLNGFNSNTYYNYIMYDIFKKNATYIFNQYKQKIKNLQN